jgi:hypothetical protein
MTPLPIVKDPSTQKTETYRHHVGIEGVILKGCMRWDCDTHVHWLTQTTSGPYCYHHCNEYRSTHQIAMGEKHLLRPENFSIQEGDEANSLSVFFDFAIIITKW